MSPDINLVAVFASALAAIVLGSLWYGPVFGKPWMALMGYPEADMKKAKTDPIAKKKMVRSYGLMAVGAFVMAFVMAYAVEFASAYTKTYGISAGLMSGFWNWLGFVAPVHMGAQLWEGKPWKLFAINAGYHFVSLTIMGLILACWK